MILWWPSGAGSGNLSGDDLKPQSCRPPNSDLCPTSTPDVCRRFTVGTGIGCAWRTGQPESLPHDSNQTLRQPIGHVPRPCISQPLCYIDGISGARQGDSCNTCLVQLGFFLASKRNTHLRDTSAWQLSTAIWNYGLSSQLAACVLTLLQQEAQARRATNTGFVEDELVVVVCAAIRRVVGSFQVVLNALFE